MDPLNKFIANVNIKIHQSLVKASEEAVRFYKSSGAYKASQAGKIPISKLGN